METDYVMRLVEKFSQTLAKIIGLKNQKKYIEARKAVAHLQNELLGDLDHDISSITAKLDYARLEILADLFFHESMIDFYEEKNDCEKKLRKSLFLYNYIQKNSPLFSLVVGQKILDINTFISNNFVDEKGRH
jgi:hypothetical protein